jgi:hypothetical protein
VTWCSRCSPTRRPAETTGQSSSSKSIRSSSKEWRPLGEDGGFNVEPFARPSDLPEKTYTTPLGKKLGAKPGVEVVVLFTTSRSELARRFDALKKTLAVADGLWIAWPKKASELETDLDFAAVQEIGLAAGLVDNKSVAIDEEWQAVRFVYRRVDRPR